MQRKPLSAYKLMVLLWIALLAVFALAVGGFIFTRSNITKYATEVSAVASEAQSSKDRVKQLKQTEEELAKYTETIDRAANIVAESKSYQYQDQIIRDLTNYATRAGIRINSFTFSDAASSAGGTATPAPAAGGQASAPAAAPAPSSGLKSTSVVINLSGDVPYKNLLTFLSLVEQNLTKMQIANISLTKSQDSDSGNVSLQTLNLEVYVR